MNVHDGMYRGEDAAIPPPNLALLEVVDQASRMLGRNKPKGILTCMQINKDGERLFAVDLVDLTSGPSGLSVCRSYANSYSPDSFVRALERLAPHGCRGDELAFACGRDTDGVSCYWVFANAVTMLPLNVEGREVRSASYRW